MQAQLVLAVWFRGQIIYYRAFRSEVCCFRGHTLHKPRLRCAFVITPGRRLAAELLQLLQIYTTVSLCRHHLRLA